MFKFQHTNIMSMLFFSYITLAVIMVVTGINAVLYMLVPIFFFLILMVVLLRKSIALYPLFFFIIGTFYGVALYFNRTSDVGAFFPIFFFSFLVLYYFYFRLWPSDVSSFLIVTNYTYLFYILVSLLCYLFLPSYYKSVSLELISFRAFHGIEGSPANIDSYSVFVLLINMFYNVRRTRWLIYILSLVVLFFAGATTPILILLVVFGSLVFLKVFRSFSVLVILFMLSMFSVFYLSLNDSVSNAMIILATNGRNIIWDQQISNMGWHNLYWGDVVASTVEIHWSGGETNNPHNVFLFLMLRLGILFSFVFMVFVILKARKQHIKKQLLVMAFLAAGISNSNVMYLGNPFYLYMLGFCLTSDKIYRDKKRILTSIDEPINERL
jgi:hypothetical protein